MQIFLTLSGHDKASIKRVSLTRDTLIGRSTGCRLRIASGSVSRKHCEIRVGEETATVIDLGSSNGTFVGSERIPAGEERELPEGVRLNVGGIRFLVSYQAPSKRTESGSDAAAGEAVAASAAPEPSEGASDDADEEPLPLGEEDDLAVLGEGNAAAEVGRDETSGENEEILSGVDEDEPISGDEDEDLAEAALSGSDINLGDSASYATVNPGSDSAGTGVSGDQQEEEDAILSAGDEDQAFSFLDDDEEDATTSNSTAKNSELGDFLNQLGRD